MSKKKKQKNKGGQQFLSPEQFLKQRARSLEIGTCYTTESLMDSGEGYAIVTRKHTGGNVSAAFFLIDAYCLGVKDSFYKLRMSEFELDDMLDRVPGLNECTYEEAHNWVYGAIDFAEEAGIAPHKSFNLTKYMLEEDTDDIPLIEYEFGKDGKHTLVAHSNLEASKYLPLLEKNLGEGNYDVIIGDRGFSDEYEDEDEYGDDDDYEDEDEDEGINPWTAFYGTKIEYTYKHPDYPTPEPLFHPWVRDELSKEENNIYLRDELTERLLALPHDELRHDLEQIVLDILKKTCDGIPDDYDKDHFDGSLCSSIILLGEVGTTENSLPLILEVMRQSSDFLDYHFSDAAHEALVPTLYKLGQNSLDLLMNFVKEEGLYIFFKCQIFPVAVQIALRQPERRPEIIEWFREVLRFSATHVKENKTFDSGLNGLLVCDVIDLQATELKPELQALFDTNLVDLSCCGRPSSVMRDLSNPLHAARLDDCILDIHERFHDMRRRFDH